VALALPFYHPTSRVTHLLKTLGVPVPELAR
jgi:hypothetical protein